MSLVCVCTFRAAAKRRSSFYCVLTQQGYPKFLSLWLLEFRDVLIYFKPAVATGGIL